MKLKGRPSLAQQAIENYRSDQMLAEYMSTKLSMEDLGNKHGISRESVRDRLRRARQRLAEARA